MTAHVSVIYIKASRERVWEGLTSATFTRQYWHQTDITSSWQIGAPVTFLLPDKSIAVAGEILESDFPSRLSYTWHVHYNEAAKKEQPSRVTFQLESVSDATKLTLVHDQLADNSVILTPIHEGWPAILSNLKTLLETSTVMAVS